ncbi:DMSO/TMAO reductase YedYZ molybdopterin-dependent catalytic subunit [Pseudorhizobium tarimense]|uniref:DMSO/TMAO reductase YedYZ molybdopterin-dependent catalytic subunit n=1 Tax=Pseudorhizobium tarimense TaxID=1079109 RepID=A0ABV2H8W2_9HYPH|nr:sulfite oxidase-like oxidoreductase [Pseudorhizobium tarimense]MCJ8520096.1 sulfite oxidase-like oxidoreductase [Pseudorhizobium tarimense]
MADEPIQTEDTKLTRTKRKWADEGRFLTGRISRPEADRLPPGQHLVKNWPVLDLGQQPQISKAQWRLDVRGLVNKSTTFDWNALLSLPQTQTHSDIHCVTTWSRYDNDWSGVTTRDFLDAVDPQPEAVAVMLTSYDGYTTNLLLSDFAAEDAIIVHSWKGEPLAEKHGGPVRLVVPHLYFWKSAKWLHRIEFLNADRAGFWEKNGYHMRGDPWAEERYSDD